jgi:hypothetical protein
MKAVLVVAVITCLFVVGLTQNHNCISRATGLSSCLAQVGTGGGNFCSECASKLISYYRDCANGTGVDAVQQRKFSSWLNFIIISLVIDHNLYASYRVIIAKSISVIIMIACTACS